MSLLAFEMFSVPCSYSMEGVLPLKTGYGHVSSLTKSISTEVCLTASREIGERLGSIIYYTVILTSALRIPTSALRDLPAGIRHCDRRWCLPDVDVPLRNNGCRAPVETFTSVPKHYLRAIYCICFASLRSLATSRGPLQGRICITQLAYAM